VKAELAEFRFYELRGIAFSLSCFGLIDTIGTSGDGSRPPLLGLRKTGRPYGLMAPDHTVVAR
jgi:hypothetical protein